MEGIRKAYTPVVYLFGVAIVSYATQLWRYKSESRTSYRLSILVFSALSSTLSSALNKPTSNGYYQDHHYHWVSRC